MRKGFINCELYGHPGSSAMLVEDERIVQIGSNEEIQGKLEKTDELVDVGGLFVVPGFVDCHMHLLELGYYLNNVQLLNVHTIDEVRRRVEEKCSEGSTKWVVGRGYDETGIPDGVINKAFLDSISTTQPIVLRRVCGHASCLNSAALEKAGITEDTIMEGGRIDFENGMVYEKAVDYVQHKIPEPDVEEIKDMILLAEEYCAKFGITAVGSDDFLSVVGDYKPVLTAYEQLSYQERLRLRIVEQCEFTSPKNYAEFLDEGYTQGVGNDHFVIGPLKLIADGSLGAKTAAMRVPYIGTEDEKGELLYSDEQMTLLVQMANRFNMGVIVHCIGDGALDQVLRIFKEEMYPGNPLHDGIVHCQIMHKDQIDKVREMNLDCYFQSLFIEDDASILPHRVSKHLAETCYPFHSLYTGNRCGNGSDAPVTVPDVLKGMRLAVTRTAADGSMMNIKEALTVEEALLSYTKRSAELLGLEGCGTLAEGNFADFVVLDQNILTAEDMAKTKVMMTVVDGKVVYER